MRKILKPAAFAVPALVALMLAAFIPAWIIRFEADAEKHVITYDEKAALFKAYKASDTMAYLSESFAADALDSQELELGDTVMERAMSQFVPDREQGTITSSATEFLTLTDIRGNSIDVRHTYIEWLGDWSNWLDIYMDAHTGEVFYFYYSSKCVTDPELYPNAGAGYTSAEAAAGVWQLVSGYTLTGVLENGGLNHVIAGYMTPGGSEAAYSVGCINLGAQLLDVKIMMY